MQQLDPDKIQQADSGKFTFHKSLNATFLEELFEGDTLYAETIFEDFLKDLPDYWSSVESAYKRRDITELSTAIHKCKTLFGYVGFTDIQEFCQEFENNCARKPVHALEVGYLVLSQKKETARLIIESEYTRLKLFNTNLR
jgi:HPt (histidine-containing phosphotransfer) domain-containing protein